MQNILQNFNYKILLQIFFLWQKDCIFLSMYSINTICFQRPIDSHLRFKRSLFFCYKNTCSWLWYLWRRITALQMNSVDRSSCKLHTFVLGEIHKIIEAQGLCFFFLKPKWTLKMINVRSLFWTCAITIMTFNSFLMA